MLNPSSSAESDAVSSRDFIVAYQGALSAEICRDIIARFEASAARYESVTAAGARPGRRGTMVNMSSDPSWTDLKQAVTDKTVACLHDYAERHQGIRFILNLEQIFLSSPVIERYAPSQGFNWHIDSGPRDTMARFLSALTYLNDVDEGGYTEFPLQQLKIQPKAGTIVMFPPYWLFPHRGAPPLREPKYKMTAYFTIAQNRPAQD